MRAAFAAFVATCIAATTPVHAVVTGAIFGPGSQSFSIAVLPPRASGGAGAEAQRFARALTRDLELSGYFRLVDPATFIERPDTAGVTAAETDFVGWAAIGAQAVVKGALTVAGDTVTLEVRLLDVAGRADVPQVSRRYTGGRADVGRMAHKTADAILEFLTGERGPFDSQIAFVSNRSGRLKDVYRLTFDMDEPVRVTDERSLVVTPRWRPDGRGIVFASYRQHQPLLFPPTSGRSRRCGSRPAWASSSTGRGRRTVRSSSSRTRRAGIRTSTSWTGPAACSNASPITGRSMSPRSGRRTAAGSPSARRVRVRRRST
jgi:Tol biopolymer transport system component